MAYRLYPAAVILTSDRSGKGDCTVGFLLKLPEDQPLDKSLAEAIIDSIREEMGIERGAEVLSGPMRSLRVEFEVHGRIHFAYLSREYGLGMGQRFNTLAKDRERLGGARVLEVTSNDQRTNYEDGIYSGAVSG